MIRGLSAAVQRFPFTVINLLGAAATICYMISLAGSPPLLVEKLSFTFLVGALLGMTAQFSAERFEKIAQKRVAVYGLAIILTAGYFAILQPIPEISQEIGIRTFVAVFALICAVLWIPSCRQETDFNRICLIHFKAIFTSVLYSGVLSAGLAAIIAAVNILLFPVPNDTYAYMMTIIWILFAVIYYLSLLPKFNAKQDPDLETLRMAGRYPKFLEILVANILIPLVAAYTLVLLAYFIKILVTMRWPSGQIGPMVLVYGAAGLVILVLSSVLENRLAVVYRKIFPKILIPIVIMQLVSVGIRLKAYGITESRYYIVLFGIFSIVVGLVLSFKPSSKNGFIAVLAAVLAIVSIIPPVDAFTVSRHSQISRVEKILQAEGILTDGKLTPKASASQETRFETTNILSYLDRQSSLKYIAWLPNDFNLYRDMKTVFGFEPTYENGSLRDNRYFYATLDPETPLLVTGYDVTASFFSTRYPENYGQSLLDFHLNGKDYILSVNRVSHLETYIAVKNSAGTELIGTGLYEFSKKMAVEANPPTGSLPPEKMTLEIQNDGYKLKIVLQSLNLTLGTEADAGADYSGLIFFGLI